MNASGYTYLRVDRRRTALNRPTAPIAAAIQAPVRS